MRCSNASTGEEREVEGARVRREIDSFAEIVEESNEVEEDEESWARI